MCCMNHTSVWSLAGGWLAVGRGAAGHQHRDDNPASEPSSHRRPLAFTCAPVGGTSVIGQPLEDVDLAPAPLTQITGESQPGAAGPPVVTLSPKTPGDGCRWNSRHVGYVEPGPGDASVLVVGVVGGHLPAPGRDRQRHLGPQPRRGRPGRRPGQHRQRPGPGAGGLLRPGPVDRPADRQQPGLPGLLCAPRQPDGQDPGRRAGARQGQPGPGVSGGAVSRQHRRGLLHRPERARDRPHGPRRAGHPQGSVPR